MSEYTVILQYPLQTEDSRLYRLRGACAFVRVTADNPTKAITVAQLELAQQSGAKTKRLGQDVFQLLGILSGHHKEVKIENLVL